MVLEVLRLIRGYVEFEARGKFPERMLNLTAARGISLWDARPFDGGLRGRMYVKDYKRIRPCARRARVRTRVVRRRGLPFRVARYRDRIGLPIGAAAGIGLLVFLSCFVWSFSVDGAEHISETRLLNVLAENGVGVGSFKGTMDIMSAQRSAMLEISELKWISLNTDGCTITVAVKEKAPKPELESQTPCNLKAKADGVITDISVRNGVTEVSRGSGVAKGDLLVSGVSLTKLNTVCYLRAIGEVYADVNSEKEICYPKQYDYYSVTENRTERSRLSFFTLEIPAAVSLTSFENAAYEQSDERLVIGDTVLPVGLRLETACELSCRAFQPTEETARRAFLNELLLYEAFEKGESAVKSRVVTVSEDRDGFCCASEYTFNENIAESVDFSVTE